MDSAEEDYINYLGEHFAAGSTTGARHTVGTRQSWPDRSSSEIIAEVGDATAWVAIVSPNGSPDETMDGPDLRPPPVPHIRRVFAAKAAAELWVEETLLSLPRELHAPWGWSAVVQRWVVSPDSGDGNAVWMKGGGWLDCRVADDDTLRWYENEFLDTEEAKGLR